MGSAPDPDWSGARHLCAMVTPVTSMSTRRSGWKQATICPRGSLEQSLSVTMGMLEPIPSATILLAGKPLVDQVALHRLRALAREALVELGRAGRIGVAGDVNALVVELIELGGELVELGLGGGPELEAVRARTAYRPRASSSCTGAGGGGGGGAAIGSGSGASVRGSSTGSGRSGCTCTGSGSTTRGCRRGSRCRDGHRRAAWRQGTRRCPSGRCPRSRSSRSRRSRSVRMALLGLS